MFLLKRRSDGRFFRNKGYHQDSAWYHSDKAGRPDDPRWVEDPSQCVPFASTSGLKNSRGVALGEPPIGIPRPKDREDYRLYWDARGKWYAKSNAKKRRDWEQKQFDKKYEIVKIEYREVK